ncbi:hypothetical protein J132_07189 [Termitomyces sp. J132]|nr:hypothetical protein H2248_004235 [Termitomyces sp. 'cryptogamus']KNZ74332.1 hypothetical protein J132_07189 [Termitomyces sp. J132]
MLYHPASIRCILDECYADRDRLITEVDEAAGTGDLESEENDSEEEASNHSTREELRKKLHMKRKFEKEIRQMEKELKEKRSKRSKRAGSEPISNDHPDSQPTLTSAAPLRALRHSAGAAVTSKGIVIRDSDTKGKGKAREEEEEEEEEEEMVVDPEYVPLPGDDAGDEFEDYPDAPEPQSDADPSA